MFVLQNKYFLLIESIKDLDIKNIKLINKYTVIYRNTNKNENLNELIKFRRLCRTKKIAFFVSNNERLASILKADGLYISAHNSNLRLTKLKISNFQIIGSAHNLKELNIKKLQRCSSIVYSRLFKVHYGQKKGFLGVIKFNLLKLSRKEDLVPLGGIKLSNLNKLRLVNCDAFTLFSEIKKKPAKVISRLF